MINPFGNPADFSPTPEQRRELDTLNEIRHCAGDLIGDELLDRIAVLQGATPRASIKAKKPIGLMKAAINRLNCALSFGNHEFVFVGKWTAHKFPMSQDTYSKYKCIHCDFIKEVCE